MMKNHLLFNPINFLAEENDSPGMLAAKRSAGVAPDMNLRERVTDMFPSSVNKAVHSGFETQRCHQNSKTWASVVPQKKDLCPPKIKKTSIDFYMYAKKRK